MKTDMLTDAKKRWGNNKYGDKRYEINKGKNEEKYCKKNVFGWVKTWEAKAHIQILRLFYYIL